VLPITPSADDELTFFAQHERAAFLQRCAGHEINGIVARRDRAISGNTLALLILLHHGAAPPPFRVKVCASDRRKMPVLDDTFQPPRAFTISATTPAKSIAAGAQRRSAAAFHHMPQSVAQRAMRRMMKRVWQKPRTKKKPANERAGPRRASKPWHKFRRSELMPITEIFC
jgi:hypothetical protein